MDIQDYIADLPVAVDGTTGRLGNHAVVHAGLQDHEERLANMDAIPLSLDTTVGNRIFAGDTMIQGDTGWRNLSDSMVNGWEGNLYIRRINNIVYLRGSIIAANATAGYPIDLMSGFRPGILTGPAGNDYGAALVFTAGNSPAVKSVSCYFDRVSIAGYDTADTYMVNVSWPTSNAWPATLPGTPA